MIDLAPDFEGPYSRATIRSQDRTAKPVNPNVIATITELSSDVSAKPKININKAARMPATNALESKRQSSERMVGSSSNKRGADYQI